MKKKTKSNSKPVQAKSKDPRNPKTSAFKGRIHADEKINKSGAKSYYLRYYEGKKHLYVPRDLYPKFINDVEADEFCKNENRILDLTKEMNKRKIPLGTIARSRNNALLLRKFGNQNGHSNAHIESIKEQGKCPNSWRASEVYLRDYVFQFFLSEKRLANYNAWYKYFHDFREWLKTAKSIKTNRVLSLSSKNHCVRVLNGFVKFLVEKNHIHPWCAVKCGAFSFDPETSNERTYKDVITKDDYKFLLEKLNYAKDYFRILYNSGMRFNELYSLSFSSVFTNKNQLPQFMRSAYEKMGGTIYGYILLEDQIALKTRKKSICKKTGVVLRKPLKSKKITSAKNSRLIPIRDKPTWDIILTNKNRVAEEYFDNKNKLRDKKSYFLLDVEENKLRADFRKHSPKRSFHSCRHSYITHLCGELIEKNIPPEPILRSITGITSDVLENYIHTFERYVLEAVMGNDDANVAKAEG